MAVKSCIFAVFVIGMVDLSAGATYPFAGTTFLQGLNSTAVSAFKSITNNPDTSMNEKNSQLSQWASQQSTEVQNAFNAWQQNMTATLANEVAQDDARAANLSSDARSLYDQTKTIVMNNDLSPEQACSQLTPLYTSASQSAISELAQAFPQYAHGNMCQKLNKKGRKKRQMFQNMRYDSPEWNSPEHHSYESWERYNGQNRQGYQNNGNLRNQGQYYYGNNNGYGYGK